MATTKITVNSNGSIKVEGDFEIADSFISGIVVINSGYNPVDLKWQKVIPQIFTF